VPWFSASLSRKEYRMIRSLTPLLVTLLLTRLYRSAEVGPFPEDGSLIAALYVLNSVPE
jgi:hypothetical protein